MRPVEQQLLATALQPQSTSYLCMAFRVTQLPNAIWRYTSNTEAVFFSGGEMFIPDAVSVDKREGFENPTNTGSFAITTPRIEPLLSFGAARLGFQIEVTVWEVFVSADGAVLPDLIAEGMCSGLTRKEDAITSTYKSYIGRLDKQIPSILYSRNDQRIPYSNDFGVDPADKRDAGTVTSLSQNIVGTAVAGARALGWFDNGFVEYTKTISQQIVTIRVPIMGATDEENTANRKLRLLFPPPMLEVGDAFYAYWGYDGAMSTSQSEKFANFLPTSHSHSGIGFLGMPHIPLDNPLIKIL